MSGSSAGRDAPGAGAGAPEADAPVGLDARDLVKVAGVRAIVSAGVLLAGFRAVSDDDYARVVIAQTWARAPALDPSGTSWLPLPFWLNGAAMLVFGRSLLVAQTVALLLGIASSLLVAAAAQRITEDRRAALLAGYFTPLVAWSAWLGVATVPELFTAALTLFAVASLTAESQRARTWGALALAAATLSRYEPWPIAIGFAVWNVVDAARAGERSRAWRALAASSIAILGPLAWMCWNLHAHGDALHFLARVTAYRRALGEAEAGALARLAAYPRALAREMPEPVFFGVLGAMLLLGPRLRKTVWPRIRRHAVPLLFAAVQIAALAAALVKDGAPTHHAERAVLFPALVLVVLVADVAAARQIPRALDGLARVAAGIVGAILFARACAAGWSNEPPRARRDSELMVGAHIEANLPPRARLFVETTDYGYFAMMARSGRPEAFVLDRDLDPRHPTAPRQFANAEAFAAWLREQGIGYVISRRDEGALTSRFGGGAVIPVRDHVITPVPATPQ